MCVVVVVVVVVFTFCFSGAFNFQSSSRRKQHVLIMISGSIRERKLVAKHIPKQSHVASPLAFSKATFGKLLRDGVEHI